MGKFSSSGRMANSAPMLVVGEVITPWQRSGTALVLVPLACVIGGWAGKAALKWGASEDCLWSILIAVRRQRRLGARS